MISIFATCKDRRDFRRLNSILSFESLTDDVIVFEDGGLEVERNEYGTPLLRSIFSEGERLAKYDIVAYSNADIILLPDFIEAAAMLDKLMPRFLMVGRRTNWQTPRTISLDDLTRHRSIFVEEVTGQSKLFNAATDYFVFRKGVFDFASWSDLAISRYFWDPWVLARAMWNNIPAVDCTAAVFAIHQNHPVGHRSWDAEGKINRELAEDVIKAGIDLDSVPYEMTEDLRVIKRDGL